MTSSISFDEIESREGFFKTKGKPEVVEWLPEPEQQERHVTLISVDDHLVEPPTMFEGRVESKFAERAPRVMTEEDGRTEYWLYDGQKHYKVGLNAVVGKPLEQRSFEPPGIPELALDAPRGLFEHGPTPVPVEAVGEVRRGDFLRVDAAGRGNDPVLPDRNRRHHLE